MPVDYLLHESCVGYSIFKVKLEADSIGTRLKEVQEKSQDLHRFGKMVQLISFAPFSGSGQALENINDVSEGIVTDHLRAVIETTLPKASKKSKVTLGLLDKNLAGSVKASFPYIECETGDTSEVVADLLRGIRQHGPKIISQVSADEMHRAQLGLGHAYSRAKVKFSVQKNDNHIIQAIATLDSLDKAVNNFCMRVREWYSWHFPELVKIVSDNLTYAKLVVFVGDKSTLSENSLHELAAIVNDDESIAQAIINSARVSMGRDISEADMENVINFAKRASSLAIYRKALHNYLIRKMGVVAPNLATLIGEMVGARLISKAGSLTNLCKYPASTVQILGAEKALFRALKTKGNTPKYGLIYHSSFIGRTPQKNKGRISRFLANKCTIASRIDNFSEAPTTKFGEALRKQVEDRMEFYATGAAPQKNSEAMKNAMDAVLADINIDDPTAGAASDVEMADGVTSKAVEQKERRRVEKEMRKKEKKEKKAKKDGTTDSVAATAEDVGAEIETAHREKKSDKKKRKADEVGADGEKKKKKKKDGKA